MGDSSSISSMRGVPMTPSAWALASLWAEIWDAPRFRSKAALTREALAPLLKIAASCVAGIQQHVLSSQGGSVDAKAAVPPQGASRDLLVALLDGDASFLGEASEPSKNPVSFVKALARSAFMTGDGDYPEGVAEASIDELLSKHCSSQLQQAELLLQDPSAALQNALEGARSSVQEIIATPPASGDLAGVANRHLLIQRLERVVEDCRSMAANSEVGPGSDADVGSSASSELTEDEPPLKRTKSQVAANLKVQKVKQHHENLQKEVFDLSRTTSALTKHEIPEDEIEAVQAELKTVEEARKKARNFGEDLLEDMLALDNLSGLAEDDRTTRKTVIAGIDGLLADVDTAKSRLANMHKQLEDKLKTLEEKKQSKADAEEPLPRADDGPTPRQLQQSALQPPPPAKDVWQKLRLPLRFYSTEAADHYLISATVPGLDLDDLKLELGSSNTLLVEGLKLPSQPAASSMRKKIGQKIKQLAQRSPKQSAKLADAIAQVAADAYVELGQGEFGRFAETFQLPEDVNTDAIDASYKDGVLRIVLPKVPRSRPPAYPVHNAGRFLGARGPRRRNAHPGLGSAAAAPWGGSLFGGHDDFFTW
eukprot:CAMPEP_0197662710 /NCGR_PEP_ID=MMETSP1338-20131121/54467_1 /TAXON_ID=43686 ORGANISM="Pelagodinium beii, Strain RCC1491" /NCGR_SAMPLE_ID=MMETSP1338 /ASSEMBLY_ACC=CAM_ASM_000754 /LENGTH=594 /DNA_ID=CAMNT_0043240669 /DNA_START=109 /DNA_END=1893 /DNA_ORIENTATION=+